ncbi:MAG TPA: hypothetical protein EYG79_13835 [Rhodobacteraceae bacterium]|nr:hypothetical protein [Paracoccaceae bacterium]
MPHDTGFFETAAENSQPLSARDSAHKQAIPDFAFDTALWRESCKSNAVIPAGYTYLAQLMGHDLGHTLAANAVPWTAHHADESMPNARYNLIENPLTLETIYGKGPVGTHGLYHARNCLFRLGKNATLALRVRYTLDEPAEPLLADMRNRATLMLHKMAVLWMQYHNKTARKIMAADGFNETSHAEHAYFFDVFTRARQQVLRSYYAVVMHDILPTVAHPAAMALSEAELETVFLLGDIPVLNGIMRAFHALPLKRYRLSSGGDFPFGQLREGEVGELRNWRIDWGQFFGPEARNKTGFSASYSALFTMLSGRSIMEADLKSAILALPYDKLHADVLKAHTTLPDTLKRDISAAELERLFNIKATECGVQGVPKGAFSQIPLFLMLMLEAQFYGEKGGLGPFGSGLLRRFLTHKISSISTGTSDTSAPAHTSISEIITFVKNT